MTRMSSSSAFLPILSLLEAMMTFSVFAWRRYVHRQNDYLMVFRQGLINFLSASQDLRQGLLIDWLSNDPPWAVTDEGNSISLGRMTAARGRNRASSQAKSSPARNELPSASYQSVST
jgi:hypothetical protein